MEIYAKLKSLNFPHGKYAVFGSGPMAVRGLKETNDCDLLVNEDLYKKLKAEGWHEKTWPSGSTSLYKEEFEAFKDWDFNDYKPDVGSLIHNAEVIDEIPFVGLGEVIKWKKAFGREKDLDDVKKIEEFLSKA